MMEKEFVSYEQAVALKELGFDEKCLTTYIYKGGLNSIWNVHCYQVEDEYLFENTRDDLWNTNSTNKSDCISAPLKQQVFRWFREKYGWYANLSSWIHEEELGTYHEYEIYGTPNSAHCWTPFKTYEEAEDACIDKLIELSKQLNKQ